jgi:dihydrofolate reductase
MEVSFVVARARNGVIGKDNGIPWRIPEDMRHFKAITMGKPVIMGRKTWDSLPKKPLPGRSNIVLTRDTDFVAQGALVAHSAENALAMAQDIASGKILAANFQPADEIAIIGGAEIYAAFLPYATRIHLTEIDADIEGDATMPGFPSDTWRETTRESHTTPDGLVYAYVTLERI